MNINSSNFSFKSLSFSPLEPTTSSYSPFPAYLPPYQPFSNRKTPEVRMIDLFFPENLQFSQKKPEETLAENACFAEQILRKKQRKFSVKYPIQIENDQEFQVSRKIIGSKGCNMKKIIDLSLNDHVFESLSRFNDPKLIKLRLRGQGSGFFEGRKNLGKFLSQISR